MQSPAEHKGGLPSAVLGHDAWQVFIEAALKQELVLGGRIRPEQATSWPSLKQVKALILDLQRMRAIWARCPFRIVLTYYNK